MSWLVSLITALVGLFLKRKESTSEALGQAETKAQDAQDNVVILQKQLDAAANAPVTNKDMADLLDKGKL